ncbi:MAG: type I-MYXAN CRISPR-associated protein Cas6/Cmx6, partial [Planctomycetes bacterium]|nr:type I-MYXAN CRISPR-associated protein Cas6/Cmx6 [Planctomycetota bacterium]
MYVDLSFTLTGTSGIAADHGYALYGAISRVLEDKVHAENGMGVHPIRGRQVGNRQLMLMPWSTLTIRVTDDQIAAMLPLAGKALRLGNASVRVGVPTVRTLVPATALRSRLVVIKVANIRPETVTPEKFTDAARRQMAEIGVSEGAALSIGKRRTVRVKQRELVGYEVVADDLTLAESIILQEHGIGGKRHMGCGLFVAVNERAASS